VVEEPTTEQQQVVEPEDPTVTPTPGEEPPAEGEGTGEGEGGN
jgi:hypothetical protein